MNVNVERVGRLAFFGSQFPSQIVGNENAFFEPPLLIESVKNLRLEYLSQGGSYAHTTQYVIKSGAQSYALHRVR